VPVPRSLQCIVFVPEINLETKISRGTLPSTVSVEDLVFNASRTALIVNSFWSGDFSLLNIAMADKAHQPYRENLLPYLRPVIEAAINSGAKAGFLSGAGPAVCCLCDITESDVVSVKVCDAIRKVAESMGFKGRVLRINPSNSGACIVQN